jgi:rod shape-determining protein MreD
MTRNVVSLSRLEQQTAFGPLVLVLVPAAALILQSYLSYKLPWFALVDLPLLVVIYFAIMLRGPIEATLAGMVIGLAQDALTGHAIGVNGMAKTIIAYTAASLGVRLDVENPLTRLLLTAVFTLANSVLVFLIEHRLMGLDLQWLWLHETARIVVNAAFSVVFFWMLDSLRRKG